MAFLFVYLEVSPVHPGVSLPTCLAHRGGASLSSSGTSLTGTRRFPPRLSDRCPCLGVLLRGLGELSLSIYFVVSPGRASVAPPACGLGVPLTVSRGDVEVQVISEKVFAYL